MPELSPAMMNCLLATLSLKISKQQTCHHPLEITTFSSANPPQKTLSIVMFS